ncbi:hypothetical protein ILYODFUR_001412 [Ilyodon furcidens]|uniref:Uncharacterized protein n=1 Tax=Ilyodon furcidens TaxID=33524 RepID=A0ABV0UZC7_9TELE
MGLRNEIQADTAFQLRKYQATTESAVEFSSEGLFQFNHPGFVAPSTAAAAQLCFPPSLSLFLSAFLYCGSEVKWAGGPRSMLHWEVSNTGKVTPKYVAVLK